MHGTSLLRRRNLRALRRPQLASARWSRDIDRHGRRGGGRSAERIGVLLDALDAPGRPTTAPPACVAALIEALHAARPPAGPG